MKKILITSIVLSLFLLVGCTFGNRQATDSLEEIGDRIFTASRNKNESVVYSAKYYSDEERQIVFFEIGLPNINGVLELRNVDCWRDIDETRFDCITTSQNDNSQLGRLNRIRYALAEMYYRSTETNQPSTLKNRTTYEFSNSDLTRIYGNRYRP